MTAALVQAGAALHVQDVLWRRPRAAAVVLLVDDPVRALEVAVVPPAQTPAAGVVVDDELVVHIQAEILPITRSQVLALHLVAVPLEMIRDVHRALVVLVQPAVVLGAVLLAHADLIPHLQPAARDVARPPLRHGARHVLDVALAHEVPRPGHGRRQAHAPAEVVQPRLKLLEQVVHRVINALAEGAQHVGPQLAVLDVVVEADPLLFHVPAAEERQLARPARFPRPLQPSLNQLAA
mmetsp:Transcript_19130/g.54011  ORF Transcript_19130/g.54011 Transcript_19130/m.54011 type:complete len:237 (-) Transcript_19130:220-930(-)